MTSFGYALAKETPLSIHQTHLGIVVGVDGSPSSTSAVEWAAHDADLRNVPIKLVHVVPPIVTAAEGWSDIPAPSDYARWQEEHARQLIEEAQKLAVEASSPSRASRVTSEVLYGPIVSTMVDLSTRADLVVVGCRGQGAVTRALLGSVSAGLIRRAQGPVAVIHDEHALTQHSPQAPVVVGIDGSPTSELATAIAFDEASRRGVGLVALHAWTDMGPLGLPTTDRAPIEWANIKVREEEVLAEHLSGWRKRYPDVPVHEIVVCDRPAPRLLEQAKNAQLLVVGSHGRGGVSGKLLGSVSRAVANSVQIPVIVARMP